ncbi:MAG: 4Fe-4S binding protein [Oscillibacter sp.]|jgi:ferredoxin|nr:4Fe-4S binding protein [Oscillibacter sp.]
MEIKRVCAVFWSPTGNTAKLVISAARAAAKRLDCPLQEINITLIAMDEKEYSFTETDLVFLGTPTYAGRVPNKLAPLLRQRLHGGGAPAAGLVTFGNRGYDNALCELCAVLEGDGFRTVSAAAFACRHAFTDTLGTGRPDWDDLRESEQIGKLTAEKVNGFTDLPAPVRVPGDPDAPYYVPLGTDGLPAKFLKARPVTDPGRCCGCGLCARICPMGAIDPKNVFETPGVCIKCQACVRRCTRHAKHFDDPAFLSHVAMLEREFIRPKENEVFW